MQQKELIEVIRYIRGRDFAHHSGAKRLLTMESNSTVFVPEIVEEGVFLSSSPKFQGNLLNGVPETFEQKAVFSWMESGISMQLKLVVVDEEWFDKIVKWLSTTPQKSRNQIPLVFHAEYFNGRDAFKRIIKRYLSDLDFRRKLEDLGFQEIRFGVQQHKVLNLR